jgi:hypothetical protein
MYNYIYIDKERLYFIHKNIGLKWCKMMGICEIAHSHGFQISSTKSHQKENAAAIFWFLAVVLKCVPPVAGVPFRLPNKYWLVGHCRCQFCAPFLTSNFSSIVGQHPPFSSKVYPRKKPPFPVPIILFRHSPLLIGLVGQAAQFSPNISVKFPITPRRFPFTYFLLDWLENGIAKVECGMDGVRGIGGIGNHGKLLEAHKIEPAHKNWTGERTDLQGK